MHEECKSKAQQQLVDMKRKQEEQQAFEKRKIEEEHRLIEKQKEDEIQREKIRSEAYQELEQLQIKKLTLKRELSNLKGLFTKKRRIGIEAVLEEIEKEEQRLKNILQGV